MPISHAHLRSFHAVATQGSFTKAADILHVTQPTLSGQVKELEERYGVKLFVRYGRHVELTDLGASAFNITKQLFQYEDTVDQLFLSAKKLTTGELQVGADSPYIITPLLAQFQRLYPDIHISIKYGNSEQVMLGLTPSVAMLRCCRMFQSMNDCTLFHYSRISWSLLLRLIMPGLTGIPLIWNSSSRNG